MLRLLSLCLLLVVLTLTVWLLSNSNTFTSPNQTLTELDESLNASSKQLAKKLNVLLSNNDANKIQNEVPATSASFSDAKNLFTNINRQEIEFSIAKLNKEVKQSKDDPSYQNRLGILYSQIGNFANAIQHFNQAINLCRNTAKLPAFKGDKSAIYIQLDCAYSNLARIYDQLGDHKYALSELNEMDKPIISSNKVSHPINIDKKDRRGSHKILTGAEAALLARADALRLAERMPEAVQEYQKLINLNPNLAIAHQRLGLVAVADNNLWLAINELQIAGQLDQSDADTQNDLGLIYQQIGDYKSAQRAFLTAHKIAPKHLSAAVNLSNSLANGGNYKAGIAIMNKSTRDHPKSPLAHNNLASLIARTNDQSLAAKEFARAIYLDPHLASAHYGLGIALLKLKSYTAAIKEFQTAMTLSPGILDLQNKIDLANRCNLRTLAYTQQNFN